MNKNYYELKTQKKRYQKFDVQLKNSKIKYLNNKKNW